MITKFCNKCSTEKPAGEFGKHSKTKDGLRSCCRLCNNNAAVVWYSRNRESVIEYQKKYLANNREKKEIYYREYHRKNSLKKKLIFRAWYEKNKDFVYLRARLWVEKNPEKIRAIKSRWQRQNPENNRATQATRRSKKAGAGGSFSKVDIAKLLILQKKKCAICGKPMIKFHADHIVPIHLGGTSNKENIQLTHPLCNQKKSHKDPIAFMQSLGKLL